ncbi:MULTISPECIES: PspC domain-containing protein [unclassified Streptomyces]|uniref:PspC domain-containing protein n=1 Tax=unclassified Streptomyces TaxID=2593676 RepID=UPI0022577DA9|nr:MULTISPECIES: PspC domain-containing protein [unclassified Streptomyces]MCX5012221.1 PspC domain-containing protein [Streptomyces sp. NBC_00555]MCX5606185.1 PspC domain-containing protein [Streptomyces sp. NBC_00047]
MTEVHDAPPAGPGAPQPPDARPPLRRSKRDKVLAGVCGGLGRYFDLDPVIFRIVLGVLAVTGGVGLIFYGFAWLLLPQEGEEDSEAKKMLTGRVEGATLAAVFAALVGCALFLSMLDNGVLAVFSVLVILALGGASYWSQRRRTANPVETEAPAPPETKAPPTPGGPSWWRDPLVKDGTTGPVGATGYLWGPADSAPAEPGATPAVPAKAPAAPARPRGGIGGRVFVLALIAGIIGASVDWHGRPLGEALQTGLAAALVVFGLGLAVSSLLGRTGFGTVVLAVLTAGLLAGAAVLPRDIGTDWQEVDWRPAAVADVRPVYEAGTGLATLDLSRLDVPKGTTLAVGASLDAGRLKVIVPREVTAEADVSIRLGDIQMPGDTSDDVRVRGGGEHRQATLPPPAGTEAGGTIKLHLNTGVGQVEVARAAS